MAVMPWVRRSRRTRPGSPAAACSHSYLAMNAVRNIAQPVGYDELMGVTEVWVDTALALGEKSLRTMDRIVRAQMRRSNSEAA